eukprot:3309347-Pyramimonas_sp.AAC.1
MTPGVSSMNSVGEMSAFAALEAAGVGEDDAPETLAAMARDVARRGRGTRISRRVSRSTGSSLTALELVAAMVARPRWPGRGAAGGAFRPRKNRPAAG